MKINKWLMGLLVSFTITIILIKYYQEFRRKGNLPTGVDTQAAKSKTEDRIVIEDAALSEPDDLTRIKGIGPKISEVLHEAGITTYAQLAAMDPEAINNILHQAGVRIAVTGTWPEQARAAMKEN